MFEKKSRRRQKQDYYRRNREVVKAKSKEYYRRNKELVKAMNRRYYLEHSMRLKEKSRRNSRDKRASRRRDRQKVGRPDGEDSWKLGAIEQEGMEDVSLERDTEVDGRHCAVISGHFNGTHRTMRQIEEVFDERRAAE